MIDKLEQDVKDVLSAPERREHLDPDRVIAMIPMRPYHQVADIGCGTGFFTVALAKYVSQGKLYALDIQEEMLEACRQHLDAVRLSNVELLSCGEKDFPLPKESLDGVFVAFVLSEVKNRKGFLTAAQEALQKSGWLALLEWYKQKMDEGPPVKDRVSEEEAKKLGEGAGLRYVSKRDLNGKSYLMLFRK